MHINLDAIVGYVKQLLSSNPGCGLTGPDLEVLVNTANRIQVYAATKSFSYYVWSAK